MPPTWFDSDAAVSRRDPVRSLGSTGKEREFPRRSRPSGAPLTFLACVWRSSRQTQSSKQMAGGLDKTACTYDFGSDGGGRITHAPSGSSFLLEGDINAYTVTMTVGDLPGPAAGPVFWYRSQAGSRGGRGGSRTTWLLPIS